MRVKGLENAIKCMEDMTAKLSPRCKETAYKHIAQSRGLDAILAAGVVYKRGNQYCLGDFGIN